MAAGRLFIPGWMPARDSDGNPIPNVSASFYQNETDVLAVVYANEGLTIPLANPVQANSSGRFPQIYADDSQIFSVSVEAPYGPPGQPFTFDGLSASQAADIAAANLAQGSADDAEAAIAAAVAADGEAGLAGALAAQAVVAPLAGSGGSALVGFQANGTGAVARTIQEKLREAFVSVKDFGAKGDGVTDDLPAFNAALASGERCIYVPSTNASYRLTGTWNVTRSVRVMGDGCVPYVGAIVANQPVTRGPGSWLYFDHSGEGVKLYGVAGQELSGGIMVGIGTIRNQPAPAPGWAPLGNGFDIVALSGDWFLDDLMLWNPTNGILHDYAGLGRLDLGRVRMAPFRKGFQIDRCYDIFRAGNIHIWPFSGIHDSLTAYRYANLVGMEFGKVDHTMIGNYFSIGCRTAIELLRGAAGGVPTHIQFDKVQADLFGMFGLYVGGDADGASIEIANFYGQGAVAADGNPGGATAGMVVNGDFCTVKAGIFQVNRTNQQAAIINGAGSRVFLGQPTVSEYNRANLRATAFAVTGGGSSIHLGDKLAVSGGNGMATQDDTGRISSHEWMDDMVSPSATVGTISNGRADRHWNRHGDKVSINLDIAVTTNGTGGGAVRVDLPIPVRGGRVFILHGQDYGLSGKALIGRCEGGGVLIYDYANAYPGADGARLILTGLYEADPL